MKYTSVPYKIFSVFNYIFMIFLALICVLPVINQIAVSFSSGFAATANLVMFWPIGFNLESYRITMENSQFWASFFVTVQRTVIGTTFSIFIVMMAAYPLSKNYTYLKGIGFIKWYFVFTMLFSGGLVPTYILIRNLGLMNSLGALILPGAVSVWNMILFINYFRAVPSELEEAAQIDGSGHFGILFKIYFPLALPAVATLTLFTAVWHWNAYFDGLIYFTDISRYPLASFMRTVIIARDFGRAGFNPRDMASLSPLTVTAAQIVIGALPVMLVYPFLQRYFVKGVILGAVKG